MFTKPLRSCIQLDWLMLLKNVEEKFSLGLVQILSNFERPEGVLLYTSSMAQRKKIIPLR